MSGSTRKLEYRRHGYSGVRKSSKQSKSALKRLHGTDNRVKIWRSEEQKKKLTEQIGPDDSIVYSVCNSEGSHSAEGIQLDQTKIIVAKVYHFFEQEYEELKKTIPGIDQTPLSMFRQRTAMATGVSETTVEEILREEARRNEDMLQQAVQQQSQVRKRPQQTDRTDTFFIKEEPVESNNFIEEDGEVKMEQIEIGEEGFS